MLSVYEDSNFREIEGLSQRGQTLSIVDLVAANTLTSQMAAYALCAMAHGSSALTAAMPGNAGKTTLLACLLTGIASDRCIHTIDSSTMLRQLPPKPTAPEAMLDHEIGSGPVYGYLWGDDVPVLFNLIEQGRPLISCLHADTLDQLTGILTSPELRVPRKHLTRIDLLCFLHLERLADGYRRRVATMYEAFGEASEHRLLFEWNPQDDTFTQHDDGGFLNRLANASGESLEAIQYSIHQFQQIIEECQQTGIRDFRQVRQRFVKKLNL